MLWHLSHRADKLVLPLADRHYNRQKIGSPQFVPPGRCLVLATEAADALWVTSWPLPQYVKHAWPGWWVNSLFRNESRHKASELIADAVAATVAKWGDGIRMITFIDLSKIRPVKRRGQAVAGFAYRKVGFEPCGVTAGGLLALQLTQMPAPKSPLNPVGNLFQNFCLDDGGREG